MSPCSGKPPSVGVMAHRTWLSYRWVGMSYDGPVVSGWGAIARTEDQARQVVLDLINESRP